MQTNIHTAKGLIEKLEDKFGKCVNNYYDLIIIK